MYQAPRNTLALDGIDIERIVREVLSALTLNSTTIAVNPAPAPINQPGVIAATANSTAPADNTASADNASLFFVPDAVGSIQVLQTLPAGTRRVRLTPQSLVPPAAKDWFRQRRIEWSPGSLPNKDTSQSNNSRPLITSDRGYG